MKDLVSFILILPFLLFFAFQPFFNEIVHLRGIALEVTLDHGLQRAAVQGYFTQAEIQNMKNTLASVGFDATKIEFLGTQEGIDARVTRGGYITGQLKYPMTNLWALPGLFQDQSIAGQYYIRSGTLMSEYLVR